MHIDVLNLLYISLLTLIILCGSVFYSSINYKLLACTFTCSFYFYCGSGLSFDNLLFNEYAVRYLIYLISFLLAMRIVSECAHGINIINVNYCGKKLCKLIAFGAYVYIAISFVDLLYPEFKLHHIFFPPRLTGDNIFYYAIRNQNNLILKLVLTLQNILLPIYLIYLNILILNKRKFLAIIIFIAVIYIDFVSREYISRNEILRHALLIFAMLFAVKENRVFITRRLIVLVSLFIVFMIPIFFGLQSYRLGGAMTMLSLQDSFLSLWHVEADYSKYYGQLLQPLISIGDYFLWMLFLPIPSILWPGKPSILINDVFTQHILGLIRGDKHFYIILPSLLGESFMIFGHVFYWMQAIFCGAITAYLFKSMYKNKYLQVNFLYFLLLFLFVGRAGTQAYLPNLINSLVSIVVFVVIARLYSAVKVSLEVR